LAKRNLYPKLPGQQRGKLSCQGRKKKKKGERGNGPDWQRKKKNWEGRGGGKRGGETKFRATQWGEGKKKKKEKVRDRILCSMMGRKEKTRKGWLDGGEGEGRNTPYLFS